MDAIALEVRTRCVGCGSGIAINGATDTVGCAACNRPIALDWNALLAELAGTGTIAAHVGDATVSVRRAPGHASCPHCTSALPDEVRQFASRGWAICPACGKKLSIRTPPAYLAWTHAELLVAEELLAPTVPPTAPVMFGCLACRAPIRADGSARIVRCETCSVDSYLPDELWARLHPPPPVTRWYLVGAKPVADRAATQPAVPGPFGPPPFLPPPQPTFADAQAMLAAAGIEISRGDDKPPPDFSDVLIHNLDLVREWDRREADGPRKWSDLKDVVMGPDGLFYCSGEVEWGDAVWCMGEDLKPRWVHLHKHGDLQLALDGKHGRLVGWTSSKHSAIVFSLADGSLQGTIGGKEPDDARVHHLDMDACRELVGDFDGTLLAIMGKRLVRYDAHGTGIATWPPSGGIFGAKAEKLHPLYRTAGAQRHLPDPESVHVESVGNQPLVLSDYAKLHVARDGRLLAESSEHLAAFDRTGKRLWRQKLPLDRVQDAPKTDAAGNIYVRGSVNGDPTVDQVLRIAADGSRCDLIATGRPYRGVLGEEDHLCVGPDGSIFLFDYGMKARYLAPNGQLRWQSPASIEQDQEIDRRAAERA